MRRKLTGKTVINWVVGMALVAGCSRPNEVGQEPVHAPAPAASVGAVLDVPSLLPLSIDALARQLGPRRPMPAGFADPAAISLAQIQGRLDSAAFFRSHGLSLVVAYDASQRHINDILLLGTDEDRLMRQGHLALGAASYLVLPVFQAHRPMQLMGLRVVASDPKIAQ